MTTEKEIKAFKLSNVQSVRGPLRSRLTPKGEELRLLFRKEAGL